MKFGKTLRGFAIISLTVGSMFFYSNEINMTVVYAESVDDYDTKVADLNKELDLNPIYDPMYIEHDYLNDPPHIEHYGSLQFQFQIEDLKIRYQLFKDISKYSNIIEVESKPFDIYNKRAIAYYRLEKYEQAISDFSKIIEDNPSFAGFYYNRGTTYYKMRQYEKAISDLSHSIEIEANDALPYVQRGNIYMTLGQYEKAIEDYTKAIQLPFDVNLDMFRNINPHISAVTMIYFKVGQSQNYTLPYLKRGIAYFHLKQYKASMADYNSAVKNNSKDSIAYQLRGICYQKLGDDKKAQADFKKSEKLSRKN